MRLLVHVITIREGLIEGRRLYSIRVVGRGQNKPWSNRVIRQINDWFGRGAAISGDYVIVETRIQKRPIILVRVRRIYFTVRVQVGHNKLNLNASDGAAGDAYSYSVDIDGDYAIVGSLNEDPGGTSNAGSAYIFTYVREQVGPNKLRSQRDNAR